MPRSRATIAACDSAPPVWVTTPAATPSSGVQAGSVCPDGDRLSPNDHLDPGWDARVLDELGVLGERLAPLNGRLAAVLPRFDGYHARYAAALRRAESGKWSWVDAVSVDSCHRVWFQLHEDLLATLGLDRSVEGDAHAGE